MTIKSRLFVSFFVILAVCSALLFSLHRLARNEHILVEIDSLDHRELIGLGHLQSMLNHYFKIILDTRSGIIDPLEEDLQGMEMEITTEFRGMLEVVDEEIQLYERYNDEEKIEEELKEKEEIRRLFREYQQIETIATAILLPDPAAAKTGDNHWQQLTAVTSQLTNNLLKPIDEWLQDERKEQDTFANAFSETLAHGHLIMNSMVLGSILIVFLVVISLMHTINRGFAGLAAGMKRIAGGDYDVRFPVHGATEFTSVSSVCNGMLDHLAETQKKMIEQSYYAGIAEMSSGILHNVRNAISPLILQIDQLVQHIDSFDMRQLVQAFRELLTMEVVGKRKDDLQEFILLGAEVLVKKKEAIGDSVDKMKTIAQSIEDIITSQSRYLTAERPLETFDLLAVFDDVLLLIPQDFLTGIRITLDPTIKSVGKVRSHRVIILQVFNNILRNAAESIRRTDSTTGDIVVRAESQKDRLRVSVTDNGEGIDQSKEEAIFTWGYSTKKAQISGFGLHWCANSMTALGGRLWAESEGPGKGACFYVEITRGLGGSRGGNIRDKT